MKKSPETKTPPTAEPLIPERLAYIFEHRPVLWFEDEVAYDALLTELVIERVPQSILEYHALKELADAQWEVMRLHRISKAALEAEIPDIIVRELGSDFWVKKDELGVFGSEEELKKYAIRATRGLRSGTEVMDDLIEAAAASYDALLYRTFMANLPTSNAIDERIARAERRRDDIIKKYEERRHTLSAMKRSLIEDKQTTDVNEVGAAEPIPRHRPVR